MKKNSFKKNIQDRYKGRGNSWVRVDKNNEGYEYILNALNTIGEESSTYLNWINREGFAWLRFSKAEGSEQQPLCTFELRFKGCKLDHPESLITFEDNIAQSFSLLGNTPHKLQLEINPEERKGLKEERFNEVSYRKEKSKEIKIIVEKIEEVKEAALTKPTTNELERWYEFLKLNNMYEDHV